MHRDRRWQMLRRMMRSLPLLAMAIAAASATPICAQADDVSEARLRADVEALAGFGTRHTLSSHDDPTRGIGAALDWAEAQFRAISVDCGDCLVVENLETTVSGERIPVPVRLRNVIAIQRGSERPDEVVIILAHIDSRASDVMDANSDAPGANDNASGSALVLEAARHLSASTRAGTIVYALVSGEEQGFYGAAALADHALAQGWVVKAVLNNDIVGRSCGSDGTCDAAHVRIFSEDIRADADEATREQMRRMGGANDSPSRNLSRFVAGLAEVGAEDFAVRQVWRADRMGRGGDHLPFLERGMPAIRFSAAIEDYEHQHQDVRVEDGVAYGDTVTEMDFAYLASVTRLNVTAVDALARAPMPPIVQFDGVARNDVLIEWLPVAGAARYNIWRRATDARDWELRETLEADAAADLNSLTLSPDRGDDWIFGISAIAADGAESPVASAVPGGDFYPLVR